jgi:hypothetical protein
MPPGGCSIPQPQRASGRRPTPFVPFFLMPTNRGIYRHTASYHPLSCATNAEYVVCFCCYVYVFLLLCYVFLLLCLCILIVMLCILIVMFMYSYCYVCVFLLLCCVFLLLCLCILTVMFMYSYCYLYVFLLLCLCILIVMLCILIVMYVLFCIFCFHRANRHTSATLTEVFPCFFLNCKANARV